MAEKGKIHSLESCGTVDGPGIRFVVFFQGCPLRCLYCHNPDTWDAKGGKEMSINEVMAEILKYKSYMKFSKGGVTLTGGEPLMQPDFTLDLLKECRKHGIHTALDTSGYLFNEKTRQILAYVDLVLLDIKHYDASRYKDLTGVRLEPTLQFMEYISSRNIPTWIRYVLVPGLTDQAESIDGLSRYLSGFGNIERIEILPYHKLGNFKWQELGIDNPLEGTDEPTADELKEAVELFEKHNANVVTDLSS